MSESPLKKFILIYKVGPKGVFFIFIGNIELPRYAALAPMAGVADRAMRELSREYGAVWTVGEMVSSKGLDFGSKKTALLLETGPLEHPLACQLFGSEPEAMARAARLALPYCPDAIDINFGCPAPKIAGNGGGSALMRDPELAARITEAVARAVAPLPVTVKFRAGWDEEHKNAVEFAKLMEGAGAAALTVHGRTRAQMYAPPVDVDIIRRVKQAVTVPVIGNGDIASPEDARRMYDETGCDLVMIGRGALGRPWLFGQIREYLETGAYTPDPAPEERMALLRRHAALICRYKGDFIGIRETRKHAAWYIKGMAGAAAFRRECGEIASLDDLARLTELVVAAAERGPAAANGEI